MRPRIVAALALAISIFAFADAAGDPPPFQPLQWRFIGPFRGGRVLAVAGIPGDARHFYFGAVDGGIWETDDTGRTWRPIFDGEPAGSIGAIALAPSDPNTIYAGTGEADMRSDIAHGNGVYKSVDGGKQWTHVGLEDTRQIGRILVDPRNPARVFVAALGHAYGPNPERGVFRSDDGGAHWSKVLFVDNNTGAIDLAFKPGDPDTIYATLWQTRRPPWSIYPPSDGPGSGLFVSHDGGNRWTHVSGNGFPAHPGRIGIAVTQAASDRVFALADGPTGESGLYRSDDAGANWTKISDDPRIWQRGWYFSRLTVDPKDADLIYVMNTIVLRSDDGGRHFIALKGDPTGDDFHELWIDPTDSDRQILGSDQGALITLNDGKTWSSWYNQPTAQIYHVATDNRFPYWVYGAQQDSGAVALPSRTDSSDGIAMQAFHEITAGGESGMIAPDPKDLDIVYGNRVVKLDLKSNQTRNVDPTFAYPALRNRNAWTLPLVFSRRDPRFLYFANQKLFATADGGNHWAVISPDLTRPDAEIPANLDDTTAADDAHDGTPRGVIYSIGPSPREAKVLWAGTDDGFVWRTDDGGRHWKNVTPSRLTAWSKIACIEPSRFALDTAYMAVDRHRLDDDRPYLYRTQDGGTHWTLIVDGMPDDAFVNVVREDPERKGLIYAGTERGIFVSFDDGAHWQSLGQNLPMTSVRDIDVHGDDLVIATHGRGFWIMDDMTALRQMNGLEPGFSLFRPAIAIRVKLPQFTGTPMPRDEPHALNPPAGAIIDYALPRSSAGIVTLTIFDAHKRVVRKFTSADPIRTADPSKLAFAAEWLPASSVISSAPGMHRFVWDMRYPPLLPPAEDGRSQKGVWAAPGRYTIALEADGRSLSQPLLVKADPRTSVPNSALERAFILAKKVETAQAECAAAIKEATERLKALDARSADAGNARHAIAELMANISDISGVELHADPRPAFGATRHRADSLGTLAKDFENVRTAVEDADAAPSRDALASYAALSKMLAATMRKWERVRKTDLPSHASAHAAP